MTILLKTILLIFSLTNLGQTRTDFKKTGSGHLYEFSPTLQHKLCVISNSDSIYFNKLLKLYKYRDAVIIYSLTDLKLKRDGKIFDNVIYQNIDDKSQFLIELNQINKFSYRIVVNTKIKIIGRPGTGGISYHLSKSKKHIMCLNGQNGHSIGISIDDGMKGGFPAPAFENSKVSWQYY